MCRWARRPYLTSKLGYVSIYKAEGTATGRAPTLPAHARSNLQQYDKQPMAETMADTALASAQRHSNSVPGE